MNVILPHFKLTWKEQVYQLQTMIPYQSNKVMSSNKRGKMKKQ